MEIDSHGRNLERDNIFVLVSPWKVPSFVYFLIERKIPKNFGLIHYSYPKKILDEDPFLTRKYFLEIINSISRDLAKLNNQKPRNFYMYGQSLGCLFCVIVADFIKIRKMALIVPGLSLPESFWQGNSTRELKEKMEKKGITLAKLKEIWKDISPENYFKDKALGCEFFITLSTKDRIIPYKDGLKLIELLKSENIKFTLRKSGKYSHRELVLLDILFFKTARFLFS